MNGVSHLLVFVVAGGVLTALSFVFVVAGGVLTALSFLWGLPSFDSSGADYNSFAAMLKIIGGVAMGLMVPVLSAYIAESIGKRPALVPGFVAGMIAIHSFAAMLKIIGGVAMGLMVPVLSAYIAESIGKRPALVPGFVAGMIAIQGLPVNATTGMIDAGGAGVGFGFLGGIVGGFLAGYVIILFVAFKKHEWTKAQKAAEAEVATAEVAAIEAEQASDEGFVKASNVSCGQTVENRDAALALISERAVEAGIAEDSAALYAAFLKREAEGTTGMVEGFAIPHAKSDTVKAAQVMVLKSSEGIASWETMDESPVTCAIALLVP